LGKAQINLFPHRALQQWNYTIKPQAAISRNHQLIFEQRLIVMLVLALTSIVWIPIVLLLLPAFVFFIVSLSFKLAYLVVIAGVKAPLIIWHYLHYLFVPHPAETAYKVGMAEHVPIHELASRVADVMYTYDLKDFDSLPKHWKSKNWTRRIEAFQKRLEAEDRFMEELIRNLRLKDQFRDRSSTHV
jgi:hypothetical protein